ncbi:MAG TPA: DUF3822 family protein [Edaphocola sp.]|nr:DUF3822 family protein [Edaphocola sp.]
MVETLNPYWTYITEDAANQNMVGEELIIWNSGCCVYTYSEEGVLETQVYQSEKNWDAPFFEKIFLNEAMGSNSHKIKRVWIADERSLIIPDKLYLGEESKLWLKRLHHIEADDEIFANKIPEIETHIVYAYNRVIASLMKKYFNHLEVSSLSRFSLSNLKQFKSDNSIASLILLQNTALLSITNAGKLLAHQTFEFETVENIVYKIALIAEKNDFDPMMVQFNVAGIIDSVEELALDLRSYFSDVQILTGDKGPILELLKQIIVCA